MELATDSSAADDSVMMPAGHGLIESVLLIDRPEVTEKLARVIRACGWEAIEASNAGQARGLVQRFKPDFIITEVILPGENGYEYCAFQKKENCRIPIAFLTGVRLSASRNLAMWAGADAYLTKPINGRDLYRMILTIAQTVSYQIQRAESGMSGAIRFSCKCGCRLEMGQQNAGRASICPRCRSLVRCPESTVDFGLLFQEMRRDVRNSSMDAAGIVCKSCRRTVDPVRCQTRNGYECYECGREFDMTPETMQRWELFFHDTQEESTVREFAPLQYVYVRCSKCSTYHRYFSEGETPQQCPSCGHTQSLPTVSGAPLSRAALNSTGRLFELTLPKNRHQLFLLPQEGRVSIGSSGDSSVQVRAAGVRPVHLVMRMTLNGPKLKKGDSDATVTVNGKRIRGSLVLKPGDVVRLAKNVSLRLLGNRKQSEADLISEIQNDFKDADVLEGNVEFSRPGSEVIQLYWEDQREKWKSWLKSRPAFFLHTGSSRIDFPAGVPVRIGRAIDCRVRLFRDPGVSRTHCELFNDGNRITVVDLNSESGTWINGERISKAILGVNDQLRVGDSVITVTRPD